MGLSQSPSAPFLAPFATWQDPRVHRTTRHNLLDLIFIARCAVVSGANAGVARAKFGKSQRAWLEQYLDLPNGTPSHDTFTRVFAALEGKAGVAGFLNWVAALQAAPDGQVVAIDGKTAHATVDRAKGTNPLPVVRAWATANRWLLGPEGVDTKSKELTALPKLLEVLEWTGAIVTIDALGGQTESAAQMGEKGADYVWAVKGHQDHWEADSIDAFAAVAEGQQTATVRTHTAHAKGHGRPETRSTQTMAVPETLGHQEAGQDLERIARGRRTSQERGVEKSEVRDYSSRLRPQAKKLAGAIRGRWGMENG